MFLPVAMFSGFGRLVILHEIKVKYLYASLAQEVLLHNLPLTLLMAYNNYMLSKKFKLDIVAFVIVSDMHKKSEYIIVKILKLL